MSYKESKLWLECAKIELQTLKEFSGILDKKLNEQESSMSKQEILEYDTSSSETINSLVSKKYLESLGKIDENLSDIINKAELKFDNFVKDSDNALEDKDYTLLLELFCHQEIENYMDEQMNT